MELWEWLKMRSIKVMCFLEKLLQLIRFQKEDLLIWERKINIISGITMKQSYQEKSGTKQKRFDWSVPNPSWCKQPETESVIQDSSHSAVCWNVDIVVINCPEEQDIRPQQRRNQSGSAWMPSRTGLTVVQTVKRWMKWLLKMHFWKHSGCWQIILMTFFSRYWIQ